ncbi:unnamed protein product [Effrenium voratum]|uniref:Major facilitator superfamily (MFS) profile domain-containing protein n=2 Tax=Effrenium voratum TaxID=2562239 RepID=A0AA36I2Q6_9DINO|nr:unnamed protein product [Effrenium voratum]
MHRKTDAPEISIPSQNSGTQENTERMLGTLTAMTHPALVLVLGLMMVRLARKPAVQAKLWLQPDPVTVAVLAQSFFYLPYTAMAPIVPLLCRRFELSVELWGAVCAAEGVAKIFCAVPVAGLLNNWGRKPILVWSFLCFSVAMLGLAFSGTLLEICLARLLIGAATLGQNSALQMYLSDISTPENKSRIMAPALMAQNMASVLGPLLGGQLVNLTGEQSAMACLGAATLVFTVLNQAMMKETRPQFVSLKEDDNIKPYRELFQDQRIIEAVLYAAVYWGALASVLFCLVPLILTREFDYGPSGVSLCYALVFLVGFLSSKPAAEIADRKGRKAVLIPGLSIIGVAAMLFPQSPKLALFLGEGPALAVLLSALALGMGLVSPALPAIFTDNQRPSLHVASLSLLRLSTELGAVSASLVICSFVESVGFGPPMFLAGLFALCEARRFARFDGGEGERPEGLAEA